MIIWIASYPKSGNTWLRALISTYLYSQNGNFNFNLLEKIRQFPNKDDFYGFVNDFNDPIKIPKYWIQAQKKINQNNEKNIFKTHNAMCSIEGNLFTNKENTLAVIYLVRDPRNVITSLSYHYELKVSEALEFITNKRKIIFGKNVNEKGLINEERGNVNFIGDWANHYKSWRNVNFAPVIVIKYEDLMNNTEKTFISILKFLNKLIELNIDKKKIKKVIKSCSFEVLKHKEEKEGFSEAIFSSKTVGKKIKFFNLGKKNDWSKKLDLETEEKLRKFFYNEMQELGYLK